MSSFVRFLGRRARSLVRPETQSETTAADASSLTTLRLLAIPYARTVPRTNASSHKPHHNEQLASLRMNHPPSPPTPQIIHYLLYPATMPKPNASVPRRAVEEVLGLWKNGLWVIGRAYRAVWNFTFLPQIYRDGTNAQTAIVNNHVLSGSERDSPERQSLLERTRKRIFDASDRAVLPWVSSGEEELLRQLNTHGQFVHFGHNAHVPIKRIELLFPRQLHTASFAKSPYHLNNHNDKLASNSIGTALMAHLHHLSELAPHYTKLLGRSKLVLLLSLPFYAIAPQWLTEMDALLSTYSAVDAANEAAKAVVASAPPAIAQDLHVFRELEPFVALPLAYNLIRWFSYTRCVRTANFLKDFLDADAHVRPQLRDEAARLRVMLQAEGGGDADSVEMADVVNRRVADSVNAAATTASSAKREAIREHLDKIERCLRETGVAVRVDDRLSEIVGPFVAANEQQRLLPLRSLYAVAREYGIHPPQLVRDFTKAVNRLEMSERVELARSTRSMGKDVSVESERAEAVIR